MLSPSPRSSVSAARPVAAGGLAAGLRSHLPAAAPAAVAVGLMLLWAVQNGGFDDTTWYWGALALLATLAALVVARWPRVRVSRLSAVALGLFALYVAWSYLSMAWAQYPGLALEGSNRALLYLVIFALLTIVPWTRRAALLAITAFAAGVGVIALILLIRLASNDHVAGLFIDGRLAAPTGYINSTAALLTIGALVSIALASRRELPGLVRGALLGLASADLQLAVTVQSRGWLFTLPLVALAAVVVMPDRLRFALTAAIPVLAALIPVRALLHVYDGSASGALASSAMHAAHPALMACFGAFVVGTLVAWADGLPRRPGLGRSRRRAIGVLLTVVAAAGLAGGALVVTKGNPEQFVVRQWHGFTHEPTSSSGSHFTDVGTGRFDFWRVAFDGFLAHPIGGLGQDNFADYYLPRRHTSEEPSWTHSLELRLLAHTGIVGFLLFMGFLGAAVAAALRSRRRGDSATRALAATLMLPVTVWLIHGSLDWFWEVPALTGPALGFLGAAGGLDPGRALVPAVRTGEGRRSLRRPLFAGAGLVGLLCATAVLAFPYLSVRETAAAATAPPAQALHDLHRAAQLNPLSSDPGRLGGALALRAGQYPAAAARFRQSIAAEPGGWFSWLGAGLAESALGHRSAARRDLAEAYRLDSRQPAVLQAYQRVNGRHPLTVAEAFRLLILVQ